MFTSSRNFTPGNYEVCKLFQIISNKTMNKKMLRWFNEKNSGYLSDRSFSAVLKDIAIDAGGLWFDSRADQIVLNVSKPLRRSFGAVSSRR